MTGGADAGQAVPEPADASGEIAPPVRDIDRRMKPSEFFGALCEQCEGADPARPVRLHPSEPFLRQVDEDIAAVRRECAKAHGVDRLFPMRADDRALGALDGFRAGDSMGVSCIPKEVPLLVIGDSHGDSWALAAALRLAHEPETLRQLGVLPDATPPAVVILGDLVDRGQDHAECVMLALQRMRSCPHGTVWIAGNHDVGHRWSEESGLFVSELAPAEFTEWLNAGDSRERPWRTSFGRAFLDYVHDLPRAVAFRCGLLATHGGVPHCDIFHTFGSLGELKRSAAAKDDFTWIRVAERAPVKYPNRSRRGCELGTEQLVASVAHMSLLLEREGHPRISAMVRGHDHHDSRHFVHRAGFPPMSLLTVNTMGPTGDDRSNPFVAGDLQPCIAVYVHGSSPRIVKIIRPCAEPIPDTAAATAHEPMPSSEAAVNGDVEGIEAPPSDNATAKVIGILSFRWFGQSP